MTPHQRGVEPPARHAGHRADQHAHEHRDEHRRHADRQRYLAAIHQPRQQILAERVGAAGMRPGRALQHGGEIDRVDRHAPDQRAGNHAEYDQRRAPPGSPPRAGACGNAATPRGSATAAPRRAAPRQPPGQRPQRRAMRGSSQTYSRSAIRLSKTTRQAYTKVTRHHHRRVVGEDRRDQQRADAGNAEDLFGDDGAAEHDAAAARPPASPPGSAPLRTT